jgi:hypothetical protein
MLLMSKERQMTWARNRSMMVLATLVLVVAACGGGGGDDSSPTTGAPAQTDDGATGTSSGASDQPVDDESDGGGAPGERSAVITVDGEATKYALDDVTYSPVEGVDDLTFETCSPDFFGSGRFYAIGYAVDDAGELILDADDQPGTFTMDLPPDDWEATQRDAPGFEIKLGDLDIDIATPEQAAGGTMAWTIDDTRASGTAVFVDFENTYTVDFEVICEGQPTVNADDLPSDDGNSGGGGGSGALAGAGVGSFTADGESFDGVDVYSCEPFSFGNDGPNPEDLSLLAFLGGSNGLEVEVSHSEGYDLSDGTQFDQVNLNVFYSRQGDAGLEQFEGGAQNRADGSWYTTDPETYTEVDLDEPPVVVGDHVTGSLAGLVQTWPDEGAATVDVTFDLEIPSEVNDAC